MDGIELQLARRLRAARRSRGMTQTAVGRALGLHRPAISEIEAGRRSVGSAELYELSRLYGVPLLELLAPPEDPGGDAPGVPGAPSVPSREQAAGVAIAGMVHTIVDRFDPDRIVLFGSHARGSAGPDSDVDLLVVMPVQGSRRRKAAEIGASLHAFRLPKDIVVTTPAEFAWRKDVPGTIERAAVREGRVLHARR